MKKMSIVILLFVAVLLTACGTKETVDTDVDNKTVDEVAVNSPTAVPEASTPTSVPAPAVTDKIDIVVGKDIPCFDDDMPISSFPALHIYVTGNFVRQTDNGPFKYAIPNNNIVLDVSSSVWLEQCAETYVIPHYETVEYGRYLVDVDYSEDINRTSTYITVYDTQINAGIRVVIGLGNENNIPTDEQLSYIKQYGLAEVEYIKNQVSNWPQDFAGSESAAAPVDVVSGEIPYGWYICADINKYMQINVENGEFNVIMFCDSSISNVEYMFDIVWVEGNTYSIELGEKYGIATLTDGSIQVTADKDELKVYEGSYVVQ